MANNERHVEISLDLDPSGIRTGLQEAEALMQEGVRRMGELQSGGVDPASVQGFIPSPPPPTPLGSGASPQGSGTPDPLGGNPFLGTPPPPPLSSTQGTAPSGGQSDSSGALGELHQRLNVIQQMAQSSPDIARANLSRLKESTLNASLKEPGRAEEYQELIDAIKELSSDTRESTKKKDGTSEFLNWMRANAGLQLGGQVMRQAQSGNLLSAVGTGAGGLLGMLFGPAGMAMGASIGGGIGGFIEGIGSGARGAREYERNATDLARRFGDTGNLADLRNYNIGGQYGYKAEESLQLVDQLRQERIVDNAEQASPLVQGIQQLTRALGLNAEVTTKFYAGYVQTGGDRGEDGLRQYVADIVGGAISSGFEGNVDQYAELMGSARMQVVQGSGVGVSDRAFGQMQDILANLTGTGSNTSQLLRDNPMMAQGALSTFMSMGGTTDPYGMGAGLLRLAGVEESALDRRFTTGEQQVDNAEKALQFLSARMLESSGLSASEFREGAQGNQNFVQEQLGQNVALQRQLGDFLLPGLLGREASATDIRAFEQLSNIMVANGGALPDASSPGGAEVEELLAQLGGSPADEARKAEAERHNLQMEVMSHFQELMTRTDQWMANIYEWMLQNLNLDAISEAIMTGMDWVEAGVAKTIEMTEAVIQWVNDNNIIGKVTEWASVSLEIFRGVLQPIQEVIGVLMRPGQAATRAAEDPIGTFRQANATVLGLTPVGAVFNGVRRGVGRAATIGQRQDGEPDDEFNDTPPGGVVATGTYNTFRFAPGDRVEARQSGREFQPEEGRATLEDLARLLAEGHSFDAQFHQEDMEAGKLVQETLDAIAELHLLIKGDIEEQTKQLQPGILENLLALVGLTGGTNELLAKIEGHLPVIQNLIQGVTQAVSMMGGGMMGGGMMGGGDGGGAGIFSPLQGASIDEVLGYTPSRGQSFTAGRTRRGRPGVHGGVDLDRRIGGGEGGVVVAPEGGEASVIRIGQSANGGSVQVRIRFTDEQGREITHRLNHLDEEAVYQALGVRPGSGSVQVRAGQTVGTVGATDNLSTGAHLDWKVLADGQFVDPQQYLRARAQGGGQARTIGGGNIQINAAPSGLPAGLGTGPGGAPNLSSGYESLETLGATLIQSDARFNPNSPQGRAALALALGIGGTEVYSRGSTATDFFSRRGGTNNNMLGFAQYNLAYHRDRTGTQEGYIDLFADQVTGQQAQPNGRRGQNWAGDLAQAVQSGQITSGQQLITWMQRSGLGGSNWQGVDDGWSRVPGLADQLVEYIRGGGQAASPAAAGFANQFGAVGGAYRQGREQAAGGSGNNFTASISVNVDGSVGARAEDVRNAAYQGTQAATDEFEQQWREDPNPRNDETRSAVFA